MAADKEAGVIRPPPKANERFAPACSRLEEQLLPLQAVEPRRLYRQIAEQIARLIASGEFLPGSRLPAERELAASLGVSRASVREAIISLEIGGLVEVRVGTGIFVAASAVPRESATDEGPGPFELLDARKLVEGEIAALAAASSQPSDIEALRQSVRAMEAGIRDFALREAIDREFHLLIAKATGNGSLELVVAGLWDQRAELWGRMQQHFHTPELALKTIEDHDAIVGAIASRDAEGARGAMHRHLARVAREFQRGVDGSRRVTPPRKPARPRTAAKSRQPRPRP
jgi:DNA-binding FadR family transcriptional regulator